MPHRRWFGFPPALLYCVRITLYFGLARWPSPGEAGA